ncbi:6388_t:CDS:2 [Funneliformis geosporum]|uniref:6388_t:CDS:1 n=1 Tax=Funneliformis geosporum TaxID=1117311 RepID=A0A9W4T5H5_9GLOM|nr:6388_t:CDS:2 [Funneliformis geosporum]
MAGHSHSANIKHRKDRQDSARSQLFLKVRKKIENIIREEHEVNEKSLILYQAPYGILIYLENNQEITPDSIKKLNLITLPLSSLPNYFQLSYSLKISLEENNKNDLEEYLITYLPSEFLEKMTYDEKEKKLISPNKEEISQIKKIIKENNLELVMEQEKAV